MACLQVVAVPAVTFNADTLGFCKLLSLPELFLSLIYFSFSVVIGVVGMATVDVMDFFQFYKVRFCRCGFVCIADHTEVLVRSPDMVLECSLGSGHTKWLPYM